MSDIKLLYLLMIALIFLSSCSNDNEDSNDCPIKIWTLRRTCSPDCIYSVTYGPDEENITEIITNEATYDFYKIDTGIVAEEDLIVDVCWYGEK